MTERQQSTRAGGRPPQLLTYAAAACLFMAGLTVAQGLAIGVSAEFPGVGSLTVTPAELRFDLTNAAYPPTEFPAYYLPESDDEHWDRVIILSIVASTPSWSVDIESDGLINSSDNILLPAEQLEYRVDELGDWQTLAAGGNRVIVGLGNGIDLSPDEHKLQVRLRVTGHELPGVYEGQLIFTLVADGF